MSITQEADVWRTVFETFDRVEQNSGRNAKIELLRSLDGDAKTYAKLFFYNTLNPYITYGIIPDPPKASLGLQFDPGAFLLLLTQLEKRKLTGNEARVTVNTFLSGLDPLFQKWCYRLLCRDPKLGVSYSTVAKLWGDFIPSFGVQLATATVEIPPGKYSVEPKFDGVRAIFFIRKDGGESYALTRNGKELQNVQHIIDALVDALCLSDILPSRMVYDGELLADDWNMTASIVRTMVQHPMRETLRYYLFDAMSQDFWHEHRKISSWETRQRDVQETFYNLKKDGPVKSVPSIISASAAEIKELAAGFLEQGFEGAVIKRVDSTYNWDRDLAWLKIKFNETVDGKLIGTYEGTGRNQGRLGGFIVQLENGDEVRVGGGLSDEQRNAFWLVRNELVERGVWIEFKQQKGEGINVTSRFPVFRRIREDK